MPDDPRLDFGEPRVYPDDYPNAGLGEFHPPGRPRVVEDGARDERIASEVRSRLERHEMVDASRITVHVTNGEVMLMGAADNRFIRQRAEDLAREVEGVSGVMNKIGIQPPSEEPGPILSTHEPGANRGGSTQRS
jgi:hypothetical protein